MKPRLGPGTVARLVRQALTEGRLPPQVRTYASWRAAAARAEVRRRWTRSAWRRDYRRAGRESAAGGATAAPVPVLVAGRWVSGVELGRRSLREVAQANLFAVCDLLEDAGVHYFVRGRPQGGGAVLGIAEEQRAPAVDAVAMASPGALLYAFPDGGSPVRLPADARGRRRLRRADRWLVARPHRLSPDAAVGRSQACVVEVWRHSGRHLEPPAGSEPCRVAEEDVTPVTLRVAGRALPSLPAFTTHRALHEPEFAVDAVYTWVDDTDPAWRSRYARRRGATTRGALHPEAANESRYRNREELRYSLRSLELYADFVRTIHIVTDGQVPPWLDTGHPRIRVVDHTDLLDPDSLPTFNSHAIESGLHRIDGLAEHYLYLNDDFFLGREVTPLTFFTANGLPRFFPDEAAPIPPGPSSPADRPVDSAAKNVRDIVREEFGLLVGRKMRHAPYAQRRSVVTELEDRFPHAFARTARSPFRDPADISVASCLSHYYGFATGRAVASTVDAAYVNIANRLAPLQLRRLLDTRAVDMFCLNETEVAPDQRASVDRVVAAFLRAYFPQPSAFEVDGDTPGVTPARRPRRGPD